MQKLTVREAAENLGISEDAVRKRIQRGTLAHRKASDGHVYVYMDNQAGAQQKTPHEPDNNRSAPDHSITLHYIDKLFATSNGFSTLSKRSGIVTTVLSLILLGLSGGAVSAEERIEFQGVGLRVPLAVFLTGGAVILSVLVVVRVVARDQSKEVRTHIQRLYSQLGFSEITLRARNIHPFGAPDMIGTLISLFQPETYYSQDARLPEWQDKVQQRLSWGVFLVLPTAAEVAVGLQVSELLQQQGLGWAWIFFILLAYASIYGAIVNFWEVGGYITKFVFVSLLGVLPLLLVGISIGYFVARVLGSN